MNVSGTFKVDAPRELVFKTIRDARTFARFLDGVRDPPSEIEVKLEGTPLGIVGRLVARSITRLVDVSKETEISYVVEALLTGKLGNIGQPALRAKAKETERQIISRLRAALASPTEAAG